MNNLISTYRLQFHKDFTFRDFERIIPYLDKLGIKTVYASPIFEAVPGSQHGYDSVNPQRINPEIGTEEQLQSIHQQLAERGINWLQDIVPNHMAFDPANRWLMDVLEKGQLSLYGNFFDIDWANPVHDGKLMVPFLGVSLEDALQNNELTVDYQDNRLVLAYYDTAYPIHLRSYAAILRTAGNKSDQVPDELLTQLDELQKITDVKRYALRCTAFQIDLDKWQSDIKARNYLKACLKAVNTNPALLKQVVDEQVYQLCFYGETDYQINFRRFFTVNSLICLNIQDQTVFEHVHNHTKHLLERGVFQGLRIDHIDGLYDPTQYLERLRELAGDDAYIVVEKILETGEDLPANWPIQGATGYEFLSLVNNLFTKTGSQRKFTQFYTKLLGEKQVVHQELHDKKAYILNEHMQGERENLCRLFLDLKLIDEDRLANLPENRLKEAIGEFLIQCPVYRYYGNQLPLDETESAAIQGILDQVRKKATLSPAADLLEEALLIKPKEGDDEYNQRALRFYQRSMQFTGPLMAKGVEDTLMYTYNRFIGHDEVGDSPEFFGLKTDDFHQKMLDRQARWPLSLNATSTHDTKRGEDVRSRLNVLTDLADEWFDEVRAWQQLNNDLKQDDSPDVNDEYFIYQTLIGSYPMPSIDAPAKAGKSASAPSQDEESFPERLSEYLQKALREAKRRSTYTEPNEAYEEATKTFALNLLDKKKPFWKRFESFHRQIADLGIINSLAQLVLKCTCPGLPDVYQGCEGWDLSLVDPDNRRPVDFDQRQRWLDELTTSDSDNRWPELWESRYDARIKLLLVHLLLSERKKQADLFANGHYIPLQVEGRYKQHVLAFARRYGQSWCVVAVPLGLAQLCREQQTDAVSLDWANTRIVLPDEAPTEWQHQLVKRTGKIEKGIAVSNVFDFIPLAVIKLNQPSCTRSAGILLPITSLPSPYGVGDFGPEASSFADFLSRSRQRYWQVLPLNPIDPGQGFSPYSTNSSMAGNPLLISPDLLVKEGLLTQEDLKTAVLPSTSRADFADVQRVKEQLFDKAYQTFKHRQTSAQTKQFSQFCQNESAWLDDFALYFVLKQQHNNQPWYTWQEEYKLRRKKALDAFTKQNEDSLMKVKWLQFVFASQWNQLKSYCNSLGIELFGDLPFYVSYDSVDVWAHPDLFSIDGEGNMTRVAGVPPDYFNANGQLWGMPTFRWDVLKKQGYRWWIDRLCKNMERYDLLRLDHFRAFADYWEVPADEKTAINGTWQPGPGAELFTVLRDELGELPFVAEDLGKIDQAVYDLRDAFGLPGMAVLQFAYGEDMPKSVNNLHNHIPNVIAYTGTHDNNTSRGWFRQDNKKTQQKQLERYVGLSVTADNVHQILSRMAYASVAQTAILPIQDVLGLDESARINNPASADNNWTWRLVPGQITAQTEEQLREWTEIYNRF
ncbi:malto-oligosyltrehalose synthase [Spirosoma oryzicola]|uniref:malto-oligosyltrehalose synthase n=1 Tax=Spirosoma oryzicola TaxID=2898794 RepID=UPI001E294B51|nr:malto-oligosyltrehalose synthase [Spirosoma oryzicola]UHG93964.1 malto-oligosyltrehalose synthase [Spirosoma oryzicola]